MPRKVPQRATTKSLVAINGSDLCYTPNWPFNPLKPYLPPECTIWDPACGDTMFARYYASQGFKVIASDIQTGHNFFESTPIDDWDIIVTNPPHSIKIEWWQHCIDLGKPYALLLPITVNGIAGGQLILQKYPIEIVYLPRRVNFKMPIKGYSGAGAQFAVAWYTQGLNIGKENTYTNGMGY